MTADIDWNPSAAHSMDEELSTSYEAAKRLVTSLQTYAQALSAHWHDESAADVADLLLDYKVMYENVAEKIPQVQQRLRETERAIALQKAQEAAREAERVRKELQAYERRPELEERYPNYDSMPKIGPARRGW